MQPASPLLTAGAAARATQGAQAPARRAQTHPGSPRALPQAQQDYVGSPTGAPTHLDGLPNEVVDAAAGVQEVDVDGAGLANAVRAVCGAAGGAMGRCQEVIPASPLGASELPSFTARVQQRMRREGAGAHLPPGWSRPAPTSSLQTPPAGEEGRGRGQWWSGKWACQWSSGTRLHHFGARCVRAGLLESQERTAGHTAGHAAPSDVGNRLAQQQLLHSQGCLTLPAPALPTVLAAVRVKPVPAARMDRTATL